MVKNGDNSASIRIQAAVMAAAKLNLDQSVNLQEEQGRTVNKPIWPNVYGIATLVAGVTAENRHEAVEIEPAIGHEIW